ncbi:acetylornithine deacetylase or succinyl-diaminopimelate desuccinylase [Paenibacillus curdlanolyticus YK9]|uniref:Probable succinyl-diaminopimelate desuccinylase n=1 Tax=Paenibacillus curdlanolyticus YK9 TaxID=717606 RepID=E0IDV4_9BACL|nr:ArgE/DapE family deacylase [Paenibacillus curdlanolyticus]EFM09308.1 acetylornithine deacetylase or succinyl-diaminopimelate desuccinylase [Paenibacillus curdlanolyticus YK9]
MDEDKGKLLAWLDQHDERLYEMIQSLVRVPSDNPLGDCRPIAAKTAELLAQCGFAPVRLPVPAEAVQLAGMQAVDNVMAELVVGDGRGPVIALNAHGDVVPPGEGWRFDPYAGDIVEGKLYGRGAAVSKSDIAVYTFAAMALRETRAAGAGKLVLAFTFDEETGGEIGPQRLLKQGQIRPDYAICAGFTHSIVNAHNGCLHLEVTVKGKSAHAAIPDTGADAIEAMNGLLNVLYAHRAELRTIQSSVIGIHSPTLNIGLINGGINTNVVPDRCAIRLDRRIIPEERPEQVERELIARLEQAAERYPGVAIEVRRILLALPFGPVSESSPLIGAIQSNASRMLGSRLPVEGVPLYADARHFYEAGIPTVMFGAGPRTLAEANGHRADEHVRLSDVSAAVRIVALSLYDLLNLA